MFEWLFGKKHKPHKVVIEVNVNMCVSGTLNVEEKRGDSLGKIRENQRITSPHSKDPIKTDKEQVREIIPNLSSLPKPKVNFGQEE